MVFVTSHVRFFLSRISFCRSLLKATPISKCPERTKNTSSINQKCCCALAKFNNGQRRVFVSPFRVVFRARRDILLKTTIPNNKNLQDCYQYTPLPLLHLHLNHNKPVLNHASHHIARLYNRFRGNETDY